MSSEVSADVVSFRGRFPRSFLALPCPCTGALSTPSRAAAARHCPPPLRAEDASNGAFSMPAGVGNVPGKSVAPSGMDG